MICEEEAVFRQGTNARTESREVFRQSLYSAAAAVIRPGEPLEAECDLPIPAEAMHSFRGSHNQVQWKLIVRGEIVGWPPLPTILSGGRTAVALEGGSSRGEVASRKREVGRERRDFPLSTSQVPLSLPSHPPGRERRAFVPGTSLSGEYRMDGVDSRNLQAVEVSVLWYSEGKGDEDLAVHEFWRKDAESAAPPRSRTGRGELGDPPSRPLQHDPAAKSLELRRPDREDPLVRSRAGDLQARPRPCGPKAVSIGKCPASKSVAEFGGPARGGESHRR